ncbi:MAG TPA: hypothetical protein VLA82_07210 [Actinomycetota bacterium]|nr:hypothetical protein [Actinomycetota bacterium]
MSERRTRAGIFPSSVPQARPRAACGLLVWIAAPPTADAVRSLCGPLGRYVRRSGARLVICDAGALAADVPTLDALTRLHLTGRRLGCRIRIRDASEGLLELATYVGLDTVLAFERSAGEAWR